MHANNPSLLFISEAWHIIMAIDAAAELLLGLVIAKLRKEKNASETATVFRKSQPP